MKTMNFTTLSSHPTPPALAHSAYGMRISNALTALEKSLMSGEQDKLLLLVEKDTMEEVLLIAIERFLRYMQCQHILVLVSKQKQSKMIRTWEQAVSWEDDRKLTELFRMTSMVHDAEEAHVCITNVFDIQTQVSVDVIHPFFKIFDAILVYDIPAIPGPGLHQIMELFVANDTCVIGLSSALTEEAGELLFGNVIDRKVHQATS